MNDIKHCSRSPIVPPVLLQKCDSQVSPGLLRVYEKTLWRDVAEESPEPAVQPKTTDWTAYMHLAGTQTTTSMERSHLRSLKSKFSYQSRDKVAFDDHDLPRGAWLPFAGPGSTS